LATLSRSMARTFRDQLLGVTPNWQGRKRVELSAI
jgi:hypothetical protein